MAKSNSICFINNAPELLDVVAVFVPGTGKLHYHGPTTQEIKVTLMAIINSLPKTEANLSLAKSYDLVINMQAAAPIVGESYGLAMAMAVYSCMAQAEIPDDIIFTGCIGPAGEVLPVQKIKEKRNFAAKQNYSRIMLPGSQLDMHNPDIAQIPVHNITQAYTLLHHAK